VLGAALLFSTGGAAIKACSLSGVQVACFRSAVAGVALLLLLPDARRRWERDTIVVGAAFAGTMILFVLATKLTTAAAAIFLQSAAPLYLLLIGPRWLGEPVRRVDVVTMAAIAVGLAVFATGTPPPVVTAPDPALGNLLGAASGVTWALTVAGLRRTARGRDTASGSVLVAGNALACLACLPWALPVAGARAADWAIVGGLGLFQLALAYRLLAAGMARVPALEAALLVLVEPVLNPVWTWLVHGEAPGARALAGGAIVLLATVARTAAPRPSPA
jgi:drug/metabolite transporter (DMT)-like permease